MKLGPDSARDHGRAVNSSPSSNGARPLNRAAQDDVLAGAHEYRFNNWLQPMAARHMHPHLGTLPQDRYAEHDRV